MATKVRSEITSAVHSLPWLIARDGRRARCPALGAAKQGCENLAEACYVGIDIATAEIGGPTYAAVRRAIGKAVRAFNGHKARYLHYLIAEIPAELGRLTPQDFHLPRLCCTEPAPYSEAEFERTVAWMRSWDLIDAGVAYGVLVARHLDVI
jgi:NitT/TauT family transport system substrate-binding protein